jgi:membrane protease subunit (stomatin/prohibitin family)
MRHLCAQLRARAAARTRAATTFCKECGCVCTPVCRYDALRERICKEAQPAAPLRYY